MPNAANFGFVARAGTSGRGDGNGIIEGYNYPYSTMTATVQAGEVLLFWRDLSQMGMIEGSFNAVSDAAVGGGTNFSPLLPKAKLERGNMIYVYSGGPCTSGFGCDGRNYYGLSVPTSLDGSTEVMSSSPGLRVAEAYAIDNKMDDGNPTGGRVTALYVYGWSGANNGVIYAPSAASPSSTTCFDTGSGKYSVTQRNGLGVNCALSFQFQ